MSTILERRLVHIAVVIVVAFILQFIAHHAIGPIVRKSVKRTKGETRLDEKKREDTIITIVRTTVIALIGLLALGSVLTILGVNVTALLTGAGIIGVFVGLSAQTTVKDLLAGIFILFEKQYRVGDIVTLSGGTTGVAGATGTVEEITLRITKLRDNSGRLITVRNGEPVVIINQTTSYSSIVLDISFTYTSDITATQKIIDKVGVDLMKDKEWAVFFTAPIKFLRVDNFTDTGVVIRASGIVTPASQWDVAGEYRKRLLAAVFKQPKVHLAHS